MPIWIAITFCLLCSTFKVAAQPLNLTLHGKSADFSIPQIANAAITIDGQLDEPEWQQAQHIQISNVTQPYNNVSTDITTYAYIFDDAETLYVAFDARDCSPETIRALLRKRDSVWSDDLVGIKLDTFNTQAMAYEFFINPLGVQIDAIENELTQNESDAWDAIWESAGQIDGTGYIVEVAIPLNALNFDDEKAEQVWGIELLRFVPREERLRISSAVIDPNNNCWICQMNQMRGIANSRQGNQLTLTPSLVLGYSEERDVVPPKEAWENDENIAPSLDVKWRVSPNLSLNATLNPDFSQVEADVAQLGINNTFSLYFPERRVFFLDNIDYFSSPNDLVYTRNINSPNYGLKLTGQKDEHTYGLFVADDDSTYVIVPGNLGSDVADLKQKSQNAALRYRFTPNRQLTIGAISTYRQSDNYHNLVTGVDFRYKLTDQDVFTGQLLYSDTDYPEWLTDQLCDDDCPPPDEITCEFGDCAYTEAARRTWGTQSESMTGNGLKLQYKRVDTNHEVYASYNAYSRDFRADLGFMTQTDWNKKVVGGQWIWRAAKGEWWNRFDLGGDIDETRNENGELLEREYQMFGVLNATEQSYLRADLVHRKRVGLRHDPSNYAIDGNTTLFEETFLSAFFRMRPSIMFRYDVRVDVGDSIDMANNRMGKNLSIAPRITWNLNRHIQTEFKHTYRRLKANGESVFTANLTDMRITYQFSARSFIRFATIYSNISRNQDNYLYQDVDARSESVSNQLLYSYMLNPQTVFFVGYSDGAIADDDVVSWHQKDRSVFMKFSYAWMM